ncbi:RDD family protein [Nocardia sp. CA-129566]|uniref:RDD family protein n=1 Tax=Nocardia sp. CA-129566 TaxID=3239976 RepID=UPI003D9572B4
MAPIGRRAAAWAIDFALIVGVAVLLGSVTHYRIADYLSSWSDLGQTGVWDVIGSNGDWGGAGKAFGWDVVHEVLVYIIEAFVALIVITFAYQFACLTWKGRTVGKVVMDIHVCPVTKSTGGLSKWVSARRAFGSTMTDVGMYSLACIALLAGKFFLSFALWLAAVVVLLFNGLPLTGPSRRSAIDRFAGTVVVTAGLYQKSWEAVKDSAVLERGIRGAQTGFDKAQSAKDVAQQAAARLAEDERIRTLRESQQAQQLRNLSHAAGRRTTEVARQALTSERGQQAQRAAKRMGAGLKNAYDKRRTNSRSQTVHGLAIDGYRHGQWSGEGLWPEGT